MKKTIAGIIILAALLFSTVFSAIPVSAAVSPTAPVFYATQQVTEGETQRIRFVSLVHSLKGEAVGYTVEAVFQKDGQNSTLTYTEGEMETDTLLGGVSANGITYTADALGAKAGILAISITDIPTDLGDVYFKVTPYVLYGGEYLYGASRWVQYTDTVSMGAVESPDWDGDSFDVSVMSFNVLNAWSDQTQVADSASAADRRESNTCVARAKATAQLVLENSPDFVCFQEFDYYYRTKTDLISDISAKYAEVELVGKMSSGENTTQATVENQSDVWNPIFYDKVQYTVVDSGIYDFTDCGYSATEQEYSNTAVIKDGQTQWRSLVWAVLENKNDGNRYVVTNMHLSTAVTYQTAEAAFVGNVLKELCRHYAYPLLACGDYNSTVDSNGCNALLQNGFYDTWTFAAEKDDVGTDHDCINKDKTNVSQAPSGNYSAAIDHILTLSALTVTSYDVITTGTYNGMNVLDISDHCPTVVHIYADAQNQLTNGGELVGDEPGVAWRE